MIYLEQIIERKEYTKVSHVLETLIDKAVYENKYIYFGDINRIKKLANNINSDDKEIYLIENSSTGVVLYSK